MQHDEKEKVRCPWCGSDPLYVSYHDTEWGVPVHDERRHFEFLILEGAQAGLSWLTILRRREGYREAYDGFDPARVAAFDRSRIEQLLTNPRIIRNRLKVESSVRNARLFLDIQDEFGSFDSYVWRFVGGKPLQSSFKTLDEVPARTAESDALSSDLRTRGFKFTGSVIMYAHMQATGMVNDHLLSCFRHEELASAI